MMHSVACIGYFQNMKFMNTFKFYPVRSCNVYSDFNMIEPRSVHE